ncbi:MAG: phosphate acyltransferase PlsX [Lachnospiraceae bacterium]|nr:phosphate acyltransferase PlsX [Lachnospiraceae bacterium]
MIRIALDAHGGDNAPVCTVDGALLALTQNPDIEIFLVGPEQVIRNTLAGKTYDEKRLTVVPAAEIIEMGEEPAAAIMRKKDSSIVVGLKMVRDGEADAFVSCGSTGAVLVGGQVIAKTLPGIRRAPLATPMPTTKGYSLLIDCGANVDAKKEVLQQFAVMGSLYAKHILGVAEPTVGLVNIGTEEEKGNALTRETYPLLRETPGIRFAGNAEARDLLFGVADVYVCEGFTGNIVLKSIEGATKALIGEIKGTLKSSVPGMLGGALIKKPLKTMMKKYDPNAVGGAMMLGLRGLVVKGHGNSDAEAVKNCILQCIAFKEQDLNAKIAEAIGGLS